MKKFLLVILFCFLTSNCFALTKEEVKPFLKKHCSVVIGYEDGTGTEGKATIIKYYKKGKESYVRIKFVDGTYNIKAKNVLGLWYMNDIVNIRVGYTVYDIDKDKQIKFLKNTIEILDSLYHFAREDSIFWFKEYRFWRNAWYEEITKDLERTKIK